MLKLIPYLVYYINMRALSLVEMLRSASAIVNCSIFQNHTIIKMKYIQTPISFSEFKLGTCFSCADNIYLLYQCVSQFVALKLKCH